MNTNRSARPVLAVAFFLIPAVVTAGLVRPSAATAQAALSVSAGAASYDLSGTGTSGVAAARVEWPLASGIGVQAGSSFFWYRTQGGNDDAMLLPEVGLMLRPGAEAPVYLGLGLGHSLGVKGNPTDDLSLYGALGLDIEDRGGWAIRPEMRVRVIDPWVNTIAEFTLGVRRRFD